MDNFKAQKMKMNKDEIVAEYYELVMKKQFADDEIQRLNGELEKKGTIIREQNHTIRNLEKFKEGELEKNKIADGSKEKIAELEATVKTLLNERVEILEDFGYLIDVQEEFLKVMQTANDTHVMVHDKVKKEALKKYGPKQKPPQGGNK